MKKLRYLWLALILVVVAEAAIVPAKTLVRSAAVSSPDLAWQDDDFDTLVKEASELYRQKKYDEALAKCLKAIELNPDDFRGHAIAGLIHMAQWKMKSASEAFAKAIAIKPDNKQLYLYKAKADRMRNEREPALAAAQKALKLDPSFAEAHMIVGDVLRYDDKRRDEAIAAYRAALKADPKLLTAYVELGETLISAKDEKGAEEVFKIAMQSDPKSMLGRFPLGRLLVKQGRLKEARSLWEGRTSSEERTFPNFITVLERAERLQAATDALAAKPDDPAALVQMGSAVMEGDSWVVNGRQERAIEYFKKALAIKPDLPAAQYGIVKAYIELADFSKEKNKNVDKELAKLKKMDAKLAQELENYRKTFSGPIKASGTTLNQ
jgi:tetratricopeptide (TPR) repeat protein